MPKNTHTMWRMLNSLKDTVVHIRVWIIYIYGNTKITQDGPKLVKVSRVGTKSLQTVDVEHSQKNKTLTCPLCVRKAHYYIRTSLDTDLSRFSSWDDPLRVTTPLRIRIHILTNTRSHSFYGLFILGTSHARSTHFEFYKKSLLLLPTLV